jgi:hypothetical protein
VRTVLSTIGIVYVLVEVITVLALPIPARATATALQIQPLQYEDTLTPGKIKSGYVDVANPGDATAHIVTQVQGFRQSGTDGVLKFFDDPVLTAAIVPALTDFNLGPHEAARVNFTVDPSKLAQGGIYAAIFFRTVPPDQSSASSFIAQSANVGTLLNLTYGTGLARHGTITALKLPFWQFGSGISGSLLYKNTGSAPNAVGYRPRLAMRVLPWGHAPTLNSGLVLPGSSRQFPVLRAGSFAGLLPVTFTDLDTHTFATRWVVALTGLYAWVAWVLLAVLLLAGLLATSASGRGWLRRRLHN